MDDFGTGLRAHLGLDAAQLGPAAELDALPAQPLAELVEVEVGERREQDAGSAPADEPELDALAQLEAELLERERMLTRREAALASRAGSLLAAAQHLYDEVMTGIHTQTDDELARLRRRKSVA